NARNLLRIDQVDGRDHIVAVRGVPGRAMLFDHEGNLWVGEDGSVGLMRVSADAARGAAQSEMTIGPDESSRAEPLASERIRVLLEDREHNIWVGSYATLHRFSRSNVVRNAAPQCFDSVDRAAALAAGDAGTLWIACGDRLTEMRDGIVVGRQN